MEHKSTCHIAFNPLHNACFSGGRTPSGELIIKRFFPWLQGSLDDQAFAFSAVFDVMMKESSAFTPTYNHVVADVAERGLLKDVLHEAVSCRV